MVRSGWPGHAAASTSHDGFYVGEKRIAISEETLALLRGSGSPNGNLNLTPYWSRSSTDIGNATGQMIMGQEFP